MTSEARLHFISGFLILFLEATEMTENVSIFFKKGRLSARGCKLPLLDLLTSLDL